MISGSENSQRPMFGHRSARSGPLLCGFVGDDRARPWPLAGFWSLVLGGIVLGAVIVALHPITSQEHCPNYGAAGNASAFADPVWDAYLPLMALAWIALVAAEQALPFARHHPGRAARAAAALSVAVVASSS